MKKTVFISAIVFCAITARAQNNVFPTPSGSVGIGTTSPVTKLDVIRNFTATSGAQIREIATFISNSGGVVPPNPIALNILHARYSGLDGQYSRIQNILNSNNKGYIQFGKSSSGSPDIALAFGFNGNALMQVQEMGQVSIGNVTTPSGYKLFVEEGILTEKIKVAVEGTSNWADYVFDAGYKLMPLEEVNSFIKEHKHLPNVPSALEMVENGLDVAKTDAKLLEKIEELTLYLIALQEQVKALQEKVQALEQQKQ